MGLFSFAGSLLGGGSQKKAAKKAADAQVKAAQAAIDEQRRQFDVTRSDFSPYLSSGSGALSEINDLLGISGGGDPVDWEAYVQADEAAMDDWRKHWSGGNGALGNMSLAEYGKFHYNLDGQRRDLSPFTRDASGKQQTAIDALMRSPLYTSLIRNGEEGILANGSATGALRGGNMKGALANFRADTLADVIQQRLANLGGIAGMGQGAAGSVGAFGAQKSAAIGDALTQQGQARAGYQLAKGGINAANWQNAGGLVDSAVSAFMPGGGGLKSLF